MIQVDSKQSNQIQPPAETKVAGVHNPLLAVVLVLAGSMDANGLAQSAQASQMTAIESQEEKLYEQQTDLVKNGTSKDLTQTQAQVLSIGNAITVLGNQLTSAMSQMLSESLATQSDKGMGDAIIQTFSAAAKTK